MFKPITFDEQLVKSKNDGGLYGAIFTGGGILWGCGITTTAASVTFASGELVIRGRIIWIDGATTVQITDPIQNGYARIKARIDLTKKATQTEIEQFEVVVEFSTTTLFPELTQEPINNTGMAYEQELVVVKIDAGNVTGITRKIGEAIIDAEKLGGELPAYYATKTAVDAAQATANAAMPKAGGAFTGLTTHNAGLTLPINRYVNIGNCTLGSSGNTINIDAQEAMNVKTTGYMRVYTNPNNIIELGPHYVKKIGATALHIMSDSGVNVVNNANSGFVNITAANITGSSERYKENIREMTDDEAYGILRAVSVAFNWKKDSGLSGESFSFIAERMAEIDERFVYKNGDGQIEGILANPIMAAQNHIIKRHDDKMKRMQTEITVLKSLLVEKGICTQEEIDGLG